MKVLYVLAIVCVISCNAWGWNPYKDWDPTICCYPVPAGCCPDPCPQCLDVAWILDDSSSISAAQFADVKAFLTSFEQTFTISTDDFQTAMVQFAFSGNLRWNLGDNLNNAAEAVAIALLGQTGGLTNVNSGMQVVIDQVIGSPGDRADCENVCIVVTDGLSQLTVNAIKDKADELRMDCTLYAVGIENVDTADLADFDAQLMAIAETEENRFLVSDFSALEASLEDLLDQICADHVPETTDDCCPYDFIFFISKW